MIELNKTFKREDLQVRESAEAHGWTTVFHAYDRDRYCMDVTGNNKSKLPQFPLQFHKTIDHRKSTVMWRVKNYIRVAELVSTGYENYRDYPSFFEALTKETK